MIPDKFFTANSTISRVFLLLLNLLAVGLLRAVPPHQDIHLVCYYVESLFGSAPPIFLDGADWAEVSTNRRAHVRIVPAQLGVSAYSPPRSRTIAGNVTLISSNYIMSRYEYESWGGAEGLRVFHPWHAVPVMVTYPDGESDLSDEDNEDHGFLGGRGGHGGRPGDGLGGGPGNPDADHPKPTGGGGSTNKDIDHCWTCECQGGQWAKVWQENKPNDGIAQGEDDSCRIVSALPSRNSMKAEMLAQGKNATHHHVGMASYEVDMRNMDFSLHDMPLAYRPEFGPAVAPQIMYSPQDTDSSAKSQYTNLGARWSLNYFRYMTLPTAASVNTNVWITIADSGSVPFYGAGVGRYKSSGLGHDEILKVSDTHYQHLLTNGAVEEYSTVFTWAGVSRLFLTNFTDKWGNVVHFTYLANGAKVRLTKVKDATGKEITLQYNYAADWARVTGITDPYGRAMTIQYDGKGRLSVLTDPAGITSSFHYKSADSYRIDELTTPYGTTRFSRDELRVGTTSVGKVLEITDPESRIYRAEYRNEITEAELAAAFPDEAIPPGVANFTRSGPHTLYWSPQAREAGMTLANAYLAQWKVEQRQRVSVSVDGDTVTRTVQMMPVVTSAMASAKMPEVNRVIHDYDHSVIPGEVGGSLHPFSTVQSRGDGTVETSSYGVTARGLLAWTTDGSGRKVSYEYHKDAQNEDTRFLKTVAVALAAAPNGPSRVVLQKRENYDHGNPTKLTAADGAVTLLEYNARGQLKKVTAPDGKISERIFNEVATSTTRGRLLQQKAVLTPTITLTTQFQYDAYGRVWKITNPENETVTMEYDAIANNALKTLDRVTKVTYPSGKSERVEWWALSVKKSFDVEDKATIYDIDGNGEVKSVTTPDNKTITYERGNCCGGGIDTLVDAGGNRTHWKHDVLGRVTEKWLNWDPTHPDGTGATQVSWHYYDEVGRPSTAMDARGNVRTAVYDAQGRMTQINYTTQPGTAWTPSVYVNYETLAESVLGRVKSIGNGVYETYEYVPVNPADAVYGDGQVKKVIGTSHTTTYTYDALGRRAGTTIDRPGSIPTATTTREWDNFGRLWKIINPLGTEQITYDGNTGRVNWTTLGSLKTTYGYSGAEHRLGSIQNAWNNNPAAYTEHTYGYDGTGRLATWTRNIAGSSFGSSWTMGYDASEQLEDVAVENWVGTAAPPDEHFYQYDAAGNRTSEQRSGAVRSWTPNSLNQFTAQPLGGKMLLRGGVNVPSNVSVTALAAGGEVVNAATAGTAWKAKVSVGEGVNEFSVTATQANVPQGQVAQTSTRKLSVNVNTPMPLTFLYDADGNLRSDGYNGYMWDAENRLVGVQNSTFGLVEFAYDAFGRRTYLSEKPDLIHETRVANLLWDGLTIVGQVEMPPTGIVTNPVRLYFGNGERRLMAPGAGTNVNLLYTRDHLGSIRELVDASDGVVRAAYDYTPYGIRTKLPSIGGDLDSDFGFTGHYTNARTGLVLAPYRAYSPELGRWISRDPIEEDGGINLYGYVGNGPLQAVDPLGLDVFFNEEFSVGGHGWLSIGSDRPDTGKSYGAYPNGPVFGKPCFVESPDRHNSDADYVYYRYTTTPEDEKALTDWMSRNFDVNDYNSKKNPDFNAPFWNCRTFRNKAEEKLRSIIKKRGGTPKVRTNYKSNLRP